MGPIPSLEEVKAMDEREKELASFNPAPVIHSYAKAPELDAKRRKHSGRPTGFKQLDAIIEGVSSGELIVVTALPGVGKTSLLQSITHNLALQVIASLWWSLEVTIENFIVPFVRNDKGALWTSENKLLKVSNWPIYWPEDVTTLDIDSLTKTIRYANLKYGVQHVFIDHLTDLLDFSKVSKNGLSSMYIGSVIKELRKMEGGCCRSDEALRILLSNRAEIKMLVKNGDWVAFWDAKSLISRAGNSATERYSTASQRA